MLLKFSSSDCLALIENNADNCKKFDLYSLISKETGKPVKDVSEASFLFNIEFDDLIEGKNGEIDQVNGITFFTKGMVNLSDDEFERVFREVLVYTRGPSSKASKKKPFDGVNLTHEQTDTYRKIWGEIVSRQSLA